MDVAVRRATLELRKPVAAAGVVHGRRHSLYVELHDELHRGAAELPLAAAGPDATEEVVLAALRALLAGDAVVPSRGAAAATHLLEGASLDLALRRRGRSLASVLGVAALDVGFAGVVGIDEPSASADRAVELVAAGATRLRVKVAPSRGFDALRAVLGAVPVPVAADANGSFDPSGVEELDPLCELPLAWLEQPFPPGIDEGLERLAAHGLTLGADEAVDSLEALDRLLDRGVVAVVCIKPARLGVDGTLEAIGRASRSGVSRYVGGYFESGLGRAALGVLAASGCDLDGDVVSPAAYLVHDPCGLPGPVNGRQPLHDGPGLGPLPDERDLETLLVVRDVPADLLTGAS